jgi:hypothetical protein
MSTSGRKGNWNEMAGTIKHRHAKPVDKEVKNDEVKEVSGYLQKKSDKIQSASHKPLRKT